jgi:hypothetical protein
MEPAKIDLSGWIEDMGRAIDAGGDVAKPGTTGTVGTIAAGVADTPDRE